MADDSPATPSGTSSTPTDAPASGATAAVPSSSTAAPTPKTDAQPQTPAATDAPKADAAPADPAAAPKTDATPDPKPDAPLYTLPTDIKFADNAVKKIDSFLRSKMVDGKIVLSPQEAMDHFADQAREGTAQWQRTIEATDAKNKAICEQRFTPAQLAASETAIGFLSSFEPGFRDLAKAQLNNPVFVNAMRNIGERLSEDTLDPGSRAAPPAARVKTPAERMGYVKPPAN